MTEPWERYNSSETGAYVKFLLYLNARELCEKCKNDWSFGTSYPSDEQKYFGFKKPGMEAFF